MSKSKKVRLICDRCSKVVNLNGYIAVDDRKASTLDRAARAHEREQALAHASAGPLGVPYDLEWLLQESGYNSVPWHVFHDQCGPDDDGGHYGFPVEEFQTEADVIRWMLHVGGKAWIEFTNWDDFVRKVIR